MDRIIQARIYRSSWGPDDDEEEDDDLLWRHLDQDPLLPAPVHQPHQQQDDLLLWEQQPDPQMIDPDQAAEPDLGINWGDQQLPDLVEQALPPLRRPVILPQLQPHLIEAAIQEVQQEHLRGDIYTVDSDEESDGAELLQPEMPKAEEPEDSPGKLFQQMARRPESFAQVNVARVCNLEGLQEDLQQSDNDGSDEGFSPEKVRKSLRKKRPPRYLQQYQL